MIKKKITLENLICLFILINPILDIVSFLFRNYFNTTVSPSTILRPIIPCIVFVILFFKEKNKGKKIGISLIYGVYAIIHLLIFKKLHNGSSYGTFRNEFQYIINYSLMIINLYNFKMVIKDKEKIEKVVFISLSIYVISLFISVITKTSSTTYLEGIGYKGYFESGNSLCTTLLLGLCIILSSLKKIDMKKIILVVFTGIFLVLLVGMRTGLYGFSLILGVYILGRFLISIREKSKISKKQIIMISGIIILVIVAIFMLGSKTLQRRQLLKQNEQENVDEQTGEKRYVTGDILDVYKQIQSDTLPENYMSKQEKNAIIRLCDYAEKINLSNVNLRLQQLIYNIFLIAEQKDIGLILFGNGYKNQTGELVMEMEVPAMVCNFGLIGFALYIGPFLVIYILALKKQFINIKQIKLETIMYLTGIGLALVLSTLSGYVFFAFSSVTMVISLYTIYRKECDLN